MIASKETISRLLEGAYLDETQAEAIEEYRSRNIFSLHKELRFLLYIGVLSFCTGIGILVYKNIDTIGHAAVISFIALASIGCFIYCFRKAAPFSKTQALSENPFFDYMVLLANTLAGIFIAYLQFEYSVFGLHYGLATLLPSLLYLYSAYHFDHRGVLALGITGIGAWLGLSITPAELIKAASFHTEFLDYIGIIYGGALLVYAYAAERYRLKIHFNDTYRNFGLHLIFIAGLSGLFTQDKYFIFALIIAGAGYYFLRLAYRERSFNLLFFTTIYSYIAFSYLVFRFLLSVSKDLDTGAVFMGFMYILLSAFFLISWIVRFRKKIRYADSI